MLVVEHNDDIPAPRPHRLALRERDKHLVNVGRNWGIDEPWITRKLDAVPVVPPSDPTEPQQRNI